MTALLLGNIVSQEGRFIAALDLGLVRNIFHDLCKAFTGIFISVWKVNDQRCQTMTSSQEDVIGR